MQPVKRPRRFNLTDAAVLVLATGVGLAAIRDSLGNLLKAPMVLENGRWVARWWDPVVLLNRAVTLEVVLMAWSVGWLVLQLRQPRPRMRRLARRPGFVASFFSTFVILVCGPITAAVLVGAGGGVSGSLGEYWIRFETCSALVSLQIGAAVAAGWALLAVSRECRMRSGWLDRVGQVFGAVWVLMIPANLILPFWELL
jgi:hypothetical protein